MKLTELRQIIKEEIHKALNEEVKGEIKVGESYYFGDLKGNFTAVTITKVTPDTIHFEYDMDGDRSRMSAKKFMEKATKNPSRKR